ncbi:uncharacterized protein EMH_0032390 [Eimeria mitis]|uniref:Uncharacterized protein n=1 Tax=Eimeria mitis TaxID=44415 RepID=U6JVG7_9EIME|nr:uncharacterized protein EMH_0032390 [Eimeria mitis]CDJ27508.1 hypothetical protein EMH_0032390 [Eimeria mitis]
MRPSGVSTAPADAALLNALLVMAIMNVYDSLQFLCKGYKASLVTETTIPGCILYSHSFVLNLQPRIAGGGWSEKRREEVGIRVYMPHPVHPCFYPSMVWGFFGSPQQQQQQQQQQGEKQLQLLQQQQQQR